MTDRPPIPDLVRSSRVIAIGRNIPAALAPRIGEALVAGGVHVMKLTLNEREAGARFIVSPTLSSLASPQA
jgi:2-keto-3-deoxy-6-phosphogluconate aldolase